MMMNHYIVLKSSNGKYLSISPNAKLICDKNDIKEAEVIIMKYEGRYVTLKLKSGKFISVSMNGTLEIDKDKAGNNERFEIEWLNDDWFALKSNSGNYFSTQKDGKVEAIQKKIGVNEKFSLKVQKIESLIEFLNF